MVRIVLVLLVLACSVSVGCGIPANNTYIVNTTQYCWNHGMGTLALHNVDGAIVNIQCDPFKPGR